MAHGLTFFGLLGYNKDTNRCNLQEREDVMEIKTVTDQNYQELLAGEAPVLLDFYADWCGPCRMLSPLVDEVAEEHPEIAVGKVNVDQNPALCAAFGISSIPFLAFLRGGKLVASSLGYCAKEEIEALLSK